jgi:hypothetical protein
MASMYEAWYAQVKADSAHSGRKKSRSRSMTVAEVTSGRSCSLHPERQAEIFIQDYLNSSGGDQRLPGKVLF